MKAVDYVKSLESQVLTLQTRLSQSSEQLQRVQDLRQREEKRQ